MKIIQWLILISFLDSSYSFATSEAFAAVLDIFHNTRFHDTQITTALCITQYRFLQRNFGITAFEPQLYESCPYTTWFDSISEIAVANKIKYDFIYFVDRPDLVEALKSSPLAHFDAESFISGSNYNLIQNRQTVFASIKQLADMGNDLDSIRLLLGQSLHTIQDFYSHTNWVEMGYRIINSRIGEDSSLGIPVNPPNIDACRACSKSEMDSGEIAEMNRIQSSTFNTLLLKVIGFSFDNVYVCRDNILIKNSLTSGYYSTEKSIAPKPSGKCSHGGGTDDTDATCAPGGIAKDADTFIFAPHYYLHSIAANLSVQATIRYFEDLRQSIGDEKLFGLIIGMTKYTSLAFVVDTTASMKTSINATRLYVKQLLDNAPDDDVIIYVTLFSDPGVSQVHRYTDKPEVMAYLYSFNPVGGDNIPEMVYNAILATVKQVPPETNVYVFTDAPSKNSNLQNQIQAISNEKKLQINFILKPNQNRPSYRNSSTPTLSPPFTLRPQQYPQSPSSSQNFQRTNIWNINAKTNTNNNYNYYNYNYRGKRETTTTTFEDDENEINNNFKGFRRLARATNGLFLTPRNDEDSKTLEKMAGCGSWETIKVVEDFNIQCGNNVYNWTIPIDETIAIIEISFTISDFQQQLNSTLENLVVIFTDAAGGRLHPSTETLLVSTATTRLYRFDINNERAIWHLNFGQIECPPPPPITINIRAQSYLIANVMFYDEKTFNRIVNNQLIIGGKYNIFIDCHDCGIIDSIILNPCGIMINQGRTSNLVQRTKPNGWWFVKNVDLPPQADLICVEFSGETKKGTKFQRIHRQKISPSPFVISGRIFSPEFPSENRVYQKRQATLSFQIENRGLFHDTIEITMDGRKNNKCLLKRSIVEIEPGQTYHGVAYIEANGNANEIDNIDVGFRFLH